MCEQIRFVLSLAPKPYVAPLPGNLQVAAGDISGRCSGLAARLDIIGLGRGEPEIARAESHHTIV